MIECMTKLKLILEIIYEEVAYIKMDPTLCSYYVLQENRQKFLELIHLKHLD